ERREFGVEAELGGRKLTFAVPAAEFGRMGWVLQKLGPDAILEKMSGLSGNCRTGRTPTLSSGLLRPGNVKPCYPLQCDFSAVGRPRGMERQERLGLERVSRCHPRFPYIVVAVLA